MPASCEGGRGGLPRCHGGLKHETLQQRVEVREGPGRGTTHAGADATETSCQPAETEHGLKVGVFPKGKLPQESTHDCMSHTHRSIEEWKTNLSGEYLLFLLLLVM